MSLGGACGLRQPSLEIADDQHEHADEITANSRPTADGAKWQTSQSSCCRDPEVHQPEGRRSWTPCAGDFTGTSSARKRGRADGEHRGRGADRDQSEGGRQNAEDRGAVGPRHRGAGVRGASVDHSGKTERARAGAPRHQHHHADRQALAPEGQSAFPLKKEDRCRDHGPCSAASPRWSTPDSSDASSATTQ